MEGGNEMTGREPAAWILENHAEDMEVLYLREDGTVTGAVKPEVAENADIRAEYYEAGFLPEEGRSIIL